MPKWAHPRSRGENNPADLQAEEQLGSSPLTRGKLTWTSLRPCRTGLIPAHAGKTASRTTSSRSERAHPRSRGENTRAEQLIEHVAGSSPLTRGKRRARGVWYSLAGLIPAHAGKTRLRTA